MSGSTLAMGPDTNVTGSSTAASAMAPAVPAPPPKRHPTETTQELNSQGVADIVTREKEAEIGARQAALDALGPLARND